jgi:hypothetical protein
VLLLEHDERQYLADLTGLTSAAYASGSEVELPSWGDRVDRLNELLNQKPEPMSERDRSNEFWIRAARGVSDG